MNSIKLESKIEELSRLNDFIQQEISIINPDVDLIIEEIFVNIVQYSECSCITVQVGLDNNSSLYLEFIDDGLMFNPLETDDPDKPSSIEDARVGGMGIYFVKNLADEITYENKDNKNHLKIIKNVRQ